MLNGPVLGNGQNVLPSPEFVEVPLGQISSKPIHDGPLIGDRGIGYRVGDGVHTRNIGSIFEEDDVTVLENLAICTLDGQEILGGEDGEDKKSEANKRVDGSHRGGWEAFSFAERGGAGRGRNSKGVLS